MGNRRWTAEEEAYLSDNWGTVSVNGICKKLNRSKNAVTVRVNRLGLPPFLESGDYITLNQLYLTLRGQTAKYLHRSWIENRGMPVHMKRLGKNKVRVVYLDEFWAWAEKNRSFLDFSKLEPFALGKEPAWMKEQRRKDLQAFPIQRKDPWTVQEDDRLKALLKLHRYGYTELSEILHRSEGAILHRCRDLGLKERPIKADTTGPSSKWTDSMYKRLADGIRNGDSYFLIAKDIGKSEKAVRGKAYTTYFTEDADKIRGMLKDGPWGSGAPSPTVKQALYLNGHSVQVKQDLSRLDMLLRIRLNELGYDPYWQRHMCQHWDDVAGCAAGRTDCDSCTKFERIPPQYCARCGVTFYERTPNRFCQSCRAARKKQAQRRWCRENRK